VRPGGTARGAAGDPLVYEIRAFWEDAAVGNGTGRQGNLKYNLTRRLEDYGRTRRCGGDNLRWVETGSGRAGNAPGRITIMPNGVDLTLFGARHRADDAFARELGLGDGQSSDLSAVFMIMKGLDDLIEAMPADRASPRCALLMVGGAALADQAPPVRRPRRSFRGRVPHTRSNVTMPCATSWPIPARSRPIW
jgi:hypothetical protein